MSTKSNKAKMTMQEQLKQLVDNKTTVSLVSEAVLEARKVSEEGNGAILGSDFLDAAGFIEKTFQQQLELPKLFVDRIAIDSELALDIKSKLEKRCAQAPIVTDHGMLFSFDSRQLGFRINVNLMFTRKNTLMSTLIVLEKYASSRITFSHAERFKQLSDEQGDRNTVSVRKSTWHASAKHEINGVGRQTNIFESHVAGKGLVKGILSVPGKQDEAVAMRLMTMARAAVGSDIVDEVKESLMKGEHLNEFRAITDGYENMINFRKEVKGDWVARLMKKFAMELGAEKFDIRVDDDKKMVVGLTPKGRYAISLAIKKRETFESGKWDAAVRKMATTEERDMLREQSNSARELLKLRASLLAEKCFPEHGELAKVYFVAVARACTPDKDIFPSLMEDAYLTALAMVDGAKFADKAAERFIKLVATEEKGIQFFFPCSKEDAERATHARPQDTELVFIERRKGDYVLVLEDEQGEHIIKLQDNERYNKSLQGVDRVQGHLKTWKHASAGISIHLHDLDIVRSASDVKMMEPELSTLVVTLSESFKQALAQYGVDVMLGQAYTFAKDEDRGFTYGLIGNEKAFRVDGLHDLEGRELQSDGESFWI